MVESYSLVYAESAILDCEICNLVGTIIANGVLVSPVPRLGGDVDDVLLGKKEI